MTLAAALACVLFIVSMKAGIRAAETGIGLVFVESSREK